MSGATIRLEAVSATFGETTALVDVSLEPVPGRIHALLGPSGCGKTTLLRTMAGLTPARGRVWLDGADVTRLPTARRGVVLVHQDHLLFPGMTVLANVSYAARVRGEPRHVAEGEARRALASVKLAAHEARFPHELSGGERQRVALARALVARPRVLLLDEPLSALDASLRDELRELILEVQAAAGVTTVVVTHDQREAASLAHRISVMHAGRVLQTDTPTQLYQAPASEAVARFLGATNFYDAHVMGGVAQTSLGALALAAARPNGPARLCIWPQDIVLGAGLNTLEAVVERVDFTGSELRARLSVKGERLEMVVSRWAALSAGDRVGVHLPADRIVVLPGSP